MSEAGEQRKKALMEAMAERGATHLHVGLFDSDAVFRHKRVDAIKAGKLASQGYPFCDVLYRWDTAEELFHQGTFQDEPARLDLDSLRGYPFADRAAVCIADFEPPFGERSARNALQRQLDKAAAQGLTLQAAFEFEFSLLQETPDSLRAKDFAQLEPFAKANRTYSLQTAALYEDLLQGLEDCMETLGVTLDALHTELGPGCLEAPLRYTQGMKAADDAALFKNFAKAYFLRQGIMAAFLSKLSPDLPGQSGHVHLSLLDGAGRPLFHDASAPDGLSQQARHFIGGLLALLPEGLALCSHTVNAYKRLVPGTWAPVYAAWGVQNRSAAVRVINDSPEATRVEFRVPSSDCNPHAALALALGAGLWGMENRIEPPAARDDDCYATPAPPGSAFPATLAEAAQRLEASSLARQILGAAFIDSWAEGRRHEAAAYATQVTPWEIKRYLEVV
ncbi:MAG: glutamine synthetase [Pseudomonadota bacterium]